MASLHKLPVLFFLISLVLCFLSSRIIADLLANACNKDKACLDLLKADKAITAATNELNLGLAIMKSIIAQTKTTHDYLLKQKTKNPAYAYCEKEWLDMGPGFERILEITTKNKGYKEDADDYDFHVVGDGMGPCKSSLKDAKIDDPEITRRTHVVGTLMAAANRALLTHLKSKKTQGLMIN